MNNILRHVSWQGRSWLRLGRNLTPWCIRCRTSFHCWHKLGHKLQSMTAWHRACLPLWCKCKCHLQSFCICCSYKEHRCRDQLLSCVDGGFGSSSFAGVSFPVLSFGHGPFLQRLKWQEELMKSNEKKLIYCHMLVWRFTWRFMKNIWRFTLDAFKLPLHFLATCRRKLQNSSIFQIWLLVRM